MKHSRLLLLACGVAVAGFLTFSEDGGRNFPPWMWARWKWKEHHKPKNAATGASETKNAAHDSRSESPLNLSAEIRAELSAINPGSEDSIQDALRRAESSAESRVVEGAVLVELLEYRNWDIRVTAARLLGRSDYRDALPAMLKAAGNQEDVELAETAVGALGNLGDASALPILEKLATTHWYPPLRARAERAGRKIRGEVVWNSERGEAETLLKEIESLKSPAALPAGLACSDI